MSEILPDFSYPGCAQCVVPKVVARETVGGTKVASPVCARCCGQNPREEVEVVNVRENIFAVVEPSQLNREE